MIKLGLEHRDNSLIGMVNSMPSLPLNIRLTIHLVPREIKLINFAEDLTAVYHYILPRIKELGLYDEFVRLFGERLKEEDLIEICRYTLKKIYSEELWTNNSNHNH